MDKIKRLNLRTLEERTEKLYLDKNEVLDEEYVNLISSALANVDPASISEYPRSSREVYDRFSQTVDLPVSRILFTAGLDSALRDIFMIFRHRRVVFFSPTYALYGIYASLLPKLRSELTFTFDRDARLFKHRVGDLLTLLERQAVVVIIATPDSPTGAELALADIQAIAKAAKLNDSVLVFDRIYKDFASTFIPSKQLLDLDAKIILLNSFSKNLSLAGMRIGYIESSEELISEIEQFKLGYDLGNFNLSFLNSILDRWSEWCSCLQRHHNRTHDLRKFFDGVGLRCLAGGGNFTWVDFRDHRKLLFSLKEQFVIKEGSRFINRMADGDFWRISTPGRLAFHKLETEIRSYDRSSIQ